MATKTIPASRLWYDLPQAETLMNATNAGRFMFVWEADLDDGGLLTQFPELEQTRMLNDPNYLPPFDIRVSTDIIPRDKVVQFRLRPTALTKKICPWFAESDYVLSENVDPTKEDLIAKWLVDRHVQGQFGQREICRQVVGKQDRETGKKFLRVLSPSGACVGTETEDMSYEGE